MTYADFLIYKRAKMYRDEENLYNMHVQAFTNQRAKAVEEIGTGKNKKIVSIYKTFNDFYNHEEGFNSLLYDIKEVDKFSENDIDNQAIKKGDAESVFLKMFGNK